jgi:hypothetical protein
MNNRIIIKEMCDSHRLESHYMWPSPRTFTHILIFSSHLEPDAYSIEFCSLVLKAISNSMLLYSALLVLSLEE